MKHAIPAIEGGSPTRSTFLPYAQQWIDKEDIDGVTAALKNDWIIYGPNVEDFENNIKEYTGAGYAVSTSTGTTALHLACLAAGIGEKDRVLTSPISFLATSNSVLYCGGVPVFIDIDERTYNISPERIEEHIENHPEVKCIIPVHFGGLPCEMEEIHRMAKKHDFTVIEDAAHAIGANYIADALEEKPIKVGNPLFSDMICFSFNAVKNMTTGLGGAVCTNSKDYYERLLCFRQHGIDRNTAVKKQEGDWYHDMIELGFNYQLTGFQCALGSAQLKRIDRFIEKRRNLIRRYQMELSSVPEIQLPVDSLKNHAWHLFVIRLKPGKLNVSRKQIFDALRRENIGVNVHFIPIYFNTYYRKLGYRAGLCPEAEKYYETAITLPLFPKMTENDVLDVVNALKKVLAYYGKPHSQTSRVA